MSRQHRIFLVILSLLALFFAFENFTEIDFENFKRLKLEEEKYNLKSTSLEGVSEELLKKQLPGIEKIESSFGGKIYLNGNDGNELNTEYEIGSSSRDDKKNLRTSILNTNALKFSYDDIHLTCRTDGRLEINKELSKRSSIGISRLPANDSGQVLIKYSW